MRRMGKVLLVILAAMTLTAGVVHAESFPPTRKSTTGAIATCKARTASRFFHDDTAYLTCDLRDTRADGHPVYIVWRIDGYRDVKRWNRNGATSVVHIEDGRRNPDGSIGRIYWRVCRDRPPLLDNCSAWVTWTV